MAQSRQAMDDLHNCQKCLFIDTEDMVQCDTCNGWYHYACAGPNINHSIANVPWDCEKCVINTFRCTFQSEPRGEQSSSRPPQETYMSSRDAQNLGLKYLDEQQKLEEEQVRLSFRIQQKYMQKRFSVLNVYDKEALPDGKRENVPAYNSPRQVHFDESCSTFCDQNITPQRPHPTTTPSTIHEESRRQLAFEQQPKVSTPFNQGEESNRNLFTIRRQRMDNQDQGHPFSTLFPTSIQRQDIATSPRPTMRQEAITASHDNPFRQRDTSSSFLPLNASRNTSNVSHNASKVLTSEQIAARHVLPRELPKFSGSPKDWPLFISSYNSSTETGGYSNAENLVRLQKCISGKALDAVRSILLSPENVSQVIDTLRMLYGRPNMIIYALIEEIREVPAPKAEKLETIINFALTVQNLCSVIQNSNLESHMNNPYLMQEIVDKLPANLRLEWSRRKRFIRNSTMLDMGDWLYEVAVAASDVVSHSSEQKDKAVKPESEKKEPVKEKPTQFFVASHEDTDESATKNIQQKCKVCQQNCSRLANCKKFQELSVDERWNCVRQNKLCSTCLMTHRRFQCRDKRKCKENGCDAWHHIMLHQYQQATSAVYQYSGHSILYRIIPVIVHGPSGSVKTFAYLDEGSGITLVEEDMVTSLGIEGQRKGLCLKWTSKIQRSEPDSRSVGLEISDCFDTERFEMSNVRTVRSLELPEQTINTQMIERYVHLKNIPIQTYERAVPRILIGLENVNLLVSLQTEEGQWQEPVATRTRLGWVLQGGPQQQSKERFTCLPISESQCDSNIHRMVRDYFNIESLGVKLSDKVLESKQNERARAIMESTTIIRDRRSETGLLWKSDQISFPDNRAMALKRLENLERRMVKDDKLSANMKNHLRDYLKKGYTRQLSPEEIKVNDGRNWYIPIFPIFDPKKPEKFRIVWDAASEVDGVSLNSNLLTGPDLLQPLPAILRRFREKQFAICGDIKEMFHQIVVRPEDQNAQRFLWRDGNQARSPDVFVMQRLTFGATCSPSSAQFIKNKNAQQYEDQFPDAVTAIIKNHYVDDFIDTANSVEEAVSLVRNVQFIHSQVGFEMRKFRSNSLEVISQLGERMEDKPVNLSFNADTERILGMFWHVSSDVFTYSLQFSKLSEELLHGHRRPTKREVLRTLMTIFDPLGLLSFFLVYVKILLQDIWSSNIGWDEPINDIQFAKWTTWIELLPAIENLRIPRFYSAKLSQPGPKSIELHVFVDASESAFAAVAYLRIQNNDGVHCVLVGSKTRVSPLKPISIPRLELESGVLGSRFMQHLCETHSIKIDRRFIWTDSRVLLLWIHSDARRYRQYVAFRVTEILELTNIEEWRWVPSKDNVADDATKWIKKPDMSTGNRWFTGPEFLRENNNWAMDWTNFEYVDVEEEIRYQATHQELISPVCPDPIRFSKWERLQRTQAYVFRVVSNVETIFKNPIVTSLTTEELILAELSIFRRAQFDYFGEEIAILRWNKVNPLKQHKCLEPSSIIGQCSPYIDNDDLLRVRGRIDAVPGLVLDNRRPIILPRQHRITLLIVDWYHRKFHHGNHETVINEIRQRFFIPKVRVVLKTVVTKCQLCKNKRARPVVPAMADLPAARLNPYSRPFVNSGIDYFGPMYVTMKRSTVKRWGVLMTCLTTRAIHIELADDLSTESCIMAIRNFMVDHGQVAELFSDNGTNFHGSENELKKEFASMDPGKMNEAISSSTVKWHFNPPAASHMGGSWERLIRSVKNSLYHILGNRITSEQVLRNVLKECVGIVNSRPLTFVPIDSAESEALTPNHFILGDSGRLAVPCAIPEDAKFLNRNWKTGQMLINHFWTRWLREYLPTITRRTKWFTNVKPIEVGDVVYIIDEKSKRNSWPKGIVTQVFPGNNNVIRSAMVKSHDKEYHRPVAKLAVLDIAPPVSQPSNQEVVDNVVPDGDELAISMEDSNVVTPGENVSVTNTLQ